MIEVSGVKEGYSIANRSYAYDAYPTHVNCIYSRGVWLLKLETEYKGVLCAVIYHLFVIQAQVYHALYHKKPQFWFPKYNMNFLQFFPSYVDIVSDPIDPKTLI